MLIGIFFWAINCPWFTRLRYLQSWTLEFYTLPNGILQRHHVAKKKNTCITCVGKSRSKIISFRPLVFLWMTAITQLRAYCPFICYKCFLYNVFIAIIPLFKSFIHCFGVVHQTIWCTLNKAFSASWAFKQNSCV